MKAKEIVKVSYSGTQILAQDGTSMAVFTLRDVINKIIFYHPVPGRIQAEDYHSQVGVQLETTTDIGGGQNISYLDVGDYLDYYINIPNSGTFNVNYRTASESAGGGLQMELIDTLGKATTIHSATFPATGGWQTWTNTSRAAYIKSGLQHIRLKITKSQFNVNWFEFSILTSIDDERIDNNVILYPNPGEGLYYLKTDATLSGISSIYVFNSQGQTIIVKSSDIADNYEETIDLSTFDSGIYFVKIKLVDGRSTVKRIVQISK